MQTLTEMILRLSPPGGLFDETAVRNLLPGRSEAARKVLVHRACSAGEIIRLKPGLFLLAAELRKTHPHPFVIAALLHSPSHISLESALMTIPFRPVARSASRSTAARRRTWGAAAAAAAAAG